MDLYRAKFLKHSLFKVIFSFVFGLIVGLFFTKSDDQTHQYELNCPSRLSFVSNESTDTTIFSKPDYLFGIEINEDPKLLSREIIPFVNTVFDPNKAPDNEEFYTYSYETSPWTETSLDVDNDHDPERVLYAKTAMNHIPHIVKILEGNTVLFEDEGANINVSYAFGGGFILEKAVDWNTGEFERTRFIHSENGFIPVWKQKKCTKITIK